jgi:hypothetical protein
VGGERRTGNKKIIQLLKRPFHETQNGSIYSFKEERRNDIFREKSRVGQFSMQYFNPQQILRLDGF